jgi:hypothetical protein
MGATASAIVKLLSIGLVTGAGPGDEPTAPLPLPPPLPPPPPPHALINRAHASAVNQPAGRRKK